MNVSAKTEYACLAALALASRYDAGEPIRIREIAESQGIPSHFLVQILLQLKSAGLVVSTRGAAGGYQLARTPSEISLGQVMAVIDGPSSQLCGNVPLPTPASHALLEVWTAVDTAEREMLSATTLADLAERVRGQSEYMYYI